MKTKTALNILSKGDRVYQENSLGPSLSERSEQYLNEYAETDRKIAEKAAADETSLPFIEIVRRKMAHFMSSPNESMPIVARFDLYSAIRKMAERSDRDSGLKRLATQLENEWHRDPLGTMAYGQVTALVKRYRDQYPRSKAADAIQAECARVGLHKLPVAKLARIASSINTQEDYDAAMESHGFASDRVEHVRARAMVRSLVSIRGSNVDSRTTQDGGTDLRSATDKVADRLSALDRDAQMAPMMEEEKHKEPLPPEEMLMEEEAPAGPPMNLDAPSEAPQMEEMAPAQDMLQQIEDVTQDIVEEAPKSDPAVDMFLEHERNEGHHTEPIGGPTWGAEEILNEGHEAPPPSEQWMQEEMQEMGAPAEPAMKGPMGPPGLEAPSPLEQGMSGMDMQGKAPPGFSEQQMHELKKKYGPEDAFAVAWSIHNKNNKSGAKGKSIPLPDGKIKEQHDMADNKGIKLPPKKLKASDVEDALLSGRSVRVGDFTIRITDSDEIELWSKDAGRACGIDHMDTAIADFMAMVDDQAKRIEASKLHFSFKIDPIVHVPCEVCGEMSVFPKAASLEDSYGCDCGHQISANSADELFKAAGSDAAYQMEVKYQLTQDPVKNRQARDQILKTLQKFVPSLQVNDEGRGYVVATAWNTDDVGMQNLSKNLQAMGAVAESRRVADEKEAQMGAPAPAAPAPAAPPAAATPDMPVQEIINAGLTHYKAQGMGPGDAMAMLLKDYKEREDLKSPENQLMALAVANKLWTSGAAAPAAPMAPAAEPNIPGPVASKQAADSKLKAPAIRKPKDHVKVPADVGEDSETHGEVKLPKGEIKSQPNKTSPEQKKMSDGKMESDSETKDLLPDAGKPKATHDPKSQSGVKLPAKGLDKDSEPEEPFKTPELKSEPKVDKK